MSEDLVRPISRQRRSGSTSNGGVGRFGRRKLSSNASAFRYSRFVGRAKLILPAAAGALILILVSWPYLSAGFSHSRDRFLRPDSAMVKEIRMLTPHYNGVDREKRPFTITAENARQAPHDDSLLALDQPKAHLQSKDGAWTIVTGQTGMYQPDSHNLDLFGKVTLFHDRGYTFTTRSARVDLDKGSADSQDDIVGTGPSATISAKGFRILHGGDSILFTGKSHLTMLTSSRGNHG